MKKSFWVLLLFIACQGKSQVDLTQLTSKQWESDFDFLVNKIQKDFAGFNPELKTTFTEEAARIRAAIPSLPINKRILEMARLLALLQDGHTEISLTGPGSGFSRFPLILYYFGNDLRVVGASPQYKDLLGLRITKIENTSVTDVFEKLKPFMNKDNDIEYVTTAPNFMIIPEILAGIDILPNASQTKIALVDENGNERISEIKSVSLKEYNATEFVRLYEKTPIYLENLSKGYWFRYLPESKVLYVNFVTLYNQDGNVAIKKFISEAVEEIDNTKPEKLIVDFRMNRGGNYNNVLPLIDEIKKRPQFNTKGHLFVISGRLTFSAAAVATIFFKDKTAAIVVGEVSRSRPNWADNMESYDLPNTKLNFDCTDRLKIHSPALGKSDKIPVDVEINRSFDHYKAGRDEVLEYILSTKN